MPVPSSGHMAGEVRVPVQTAQLWPSGERASMVCFTSGTTGAPKGVALSLGALGAQGLAKLTHCGFTAETALLQSAPLSHVGGLSSAVACLMAGARHVWPARAAVGYSAQGVIEAIENEGVNALIAVPAMLEDLLAFARAHPHRTARAAARVCAVLVGGGAPTQAATHGAMRLFDAAHIVYTYGMTEACSSVTFIEAPVAAALHAGADHATWLAAGEACTTSASTGVPVTEASARARALERTSECAAFAGTCVGWAPPHVELRLDQRATPRSGNGDGGGDGNELDAVGRLSQTRGPHVMLGYWGMPRETRAVLDADGWYTSGDLCRLDSSGALWVLGRASDSIRTGGEWVMAAEVGAALESHAAVKEAAVVAVPDARLGETVAALVVVAGDRAVEATDGAAHGAETASEAALARELVDHCAARGLARYKLPRRLVLTRAPLPRNASRKVVKADVRRVVIAELAWREQPADGRSRPQQPPRSRL